MWSATDAWAVQKLAVFRSKSASTTEVRGSEQINTPPLLGDWASVYFGTAYGNRRWCSILIDRLYVQPGVGRCRWALSRGSGGSERPHSDFSLHSHWPTTVPVGYCPVSCASIFRHVVIPLGADQRRVLVEPDGSLECNSARDTTSTSGHSFEGDASSTVAASTNGNWMIRSACLRQPNKLTVNGQPRSSHREEASRFSRSGVRASGRHGGLQRKVGNGWVTVSTRQDIVNLVCPGHGREAIPRVRRP